MGLAVPHGRTHTSHLTRKDVVALGQACSSRAPIGIRNRALIAVLYGQGLRLSEALALSPDAIDFVRSQVIVRGPHSREVPLDEETAVAVAGWMRARDRKGLENVEVLFCTLSGQSLTSAYVRQLLPRLASKAGIVKRVHAQGLRDAYAVELAAREFPSDKIRSLLGYESDRSVTRYLRQVAARNASPGSPQDSPESQLPRLPTTDSAPQIWDAALDVIREQVSKPIFRTWFQGIRPGHLEPSGLVLLVPSRFAKEWLEPRYLALISRAVASAAATDIPIQLRVSVQEAAPPQAPLPELPQAPAAPRRGDSASREVELAHAVELVRQLSKWIRDHNSEEPELLAALTEQETLGHPPPRVEGSALREGEPDLVRGLTRRELEVLRLVALGSTNRQIAEALYIGEKTAGTHLSNILRKLDLRNRVEASAFAHRMGLLS